jgi:hypothetical protein
MGSLNRRDNDDRHSADEPGKKKVLEKRQKVMDHEVHDSHCSPAGERKQRKAGLLKSVLSAEYSQ